MKYRISPVVLLVLFFGSTLANAAEAWRFEKAVAAYEEKSKENPPPKNCTMFIGSSTWTLWGTQLEEDFKEFRAVNRGFGGSKIPDVIRAYDRLVSPHKPQRIVFFCGGNDIAGKAEPEKVFEDFKTFLRLLWSENPECEVFWVSVSRAPVRKTSWEHTRKLNEMAQELSQKATGLFYIDVASQMDDESGETREDLFIQDRLHLNRTAQEMWIPVIKAAIKSSNEKQEPPVDPEKIKKQRTELGIFPG